MVQAALATAGGMLSGITGAFGNQTKRQIERPQLPQTTAVIASAPDKKIAKKALDNAREERLMYLLTQPEVLGFLISIIGIIGANNIRLHEDDNINNSLQALCTTLSVLLGLGYAGVGDLTTLVMSLASGAISFFDDAKMKEDITSEISSEWYKFIVPGAGLWHAFT